MPPAFVLSQDQTLRIIKLYRRNLNLRSNFLFWFIFFDSFWIAQCKLSVTSHYSIFKQLHHDLWWFLNISQIFNLSNQVLNFFQLFLILCFLSTIALWATWFLIYHKFLFCQIEFENFFDFFQSAISSFKQPHLLLVTWLLIYTFFCFCQVHFSTFLHFLCSKYYSATSRQLIKSF